MYSDKFELRVVNLKQIELATEEDKQYQIDYWAALFIAKTWEDLKMIAQQNEYMQEATETLYELNADETIRQQCLARQDYYRTQNSYKKLIDEQTEKIDEQAEKINEQAEKIDEQAEKIDEQAETIDKQAEELESLSECNTNLLCQMEEQKKLILQLQEELKNREN